MIDSLPVPVCRRVHARRCRKVRGRAYCGYGAAKKEKFLGWRTGHSSGPIRIAIERGISINLPPDRSATTVAQWREVQR